MAVTLPNLPPVSDAAGQRLLAAFSGMADGNGAPLGPQAAYKRWLRDSLVSFVLAKEAHTAEASLVAEIALP